MRTLYFLFPEMNMKTGGHTGQVKFMEAARSFCSAVPITYKKRADGVLFLDDVLKGHDDGDGIYIIHWSYHVRGLLQQLPGKRIVYIAHSVGDPFGLPVDIPIVCVSKHTMAYWGRYAPNSLIFFLPNVLSDEFRNQGLDRDIDVLVQTRKSTSYLLEELVPAIQAKCNVVVLDSWVGDLAAYFNRSKVYLYDSLEHWNEKGITEGFGIPPLEAMACGCTVFSTLNDALSDYLDPALNCFKLRVYSKQYDVSRIVGAVKDWSNPPACPDSFDMYRMPHISARLRTILDEINAFFDAIPAYDPDIPMLNQRGFLHDRPLVLFSEGFKLLFPVGIKKYIKRLIADTDR